MDRTVNLSTKFSITQSQRIDEAVKQYGFKNTSEFLRSCVNYFFDFLELKEKLKDPEVNRKFIEEHDPLIQAERDILRLDQVVGKLTTDEINRIQWALTKEYTKRVALDNKSLEERKTILLRGAEIYPKIGYHETNLFNDRNDDRKFYIPITPDFKEKWQALSMLEKETLRDELQVKRKKVVEELNRDPHFDYQLKQITEAIKREQLVLSNQKHRREEK